ncbi:hypothetical protein AYO47_09070 [Planctomyces sp. SCGC AG-212-M04]|nr:hypothetical protein AYO47_09070 [Planctomyces sp. SCGC AG-212-M04]
MILTVSRPSRSLSYEGVAGLASVNTRSSDLVSVSYFLATPGATGLQGKVGDRYANAIADNSVQGLARLEGDKWAIEFADSESGLESMAEAAQLIAPEVMELTFRYFDGTTWYDTWDSAAVGTLPRAVEVVLGLKTPQKAHDPNSRTPADSPTVGRTIRHVIAIPLSGQASPQSSSQAATDTSATGAGSTGGGVMGSGGQTGGGGGGQGGGRGNNNQGGNGRGNQGGNQQGGGRGNQGGGNQGGGGRGGPGGGGPGGGGPGGGGPGGGGAGGGGRGGGGAPGVGGGGLFGGGGGGGPAPGGGGGAPGGGGRR